MTDGPPGPAEEPIDPDAPVRRDGPPSPRLAAVLGVIAVGGILGAEARYGLGALWPHPTGRWPWSTLLVNASGCLLIGVLMVLVSRRSTAHPLVRPFLGVGVLGGYTTFSTFTVDVVTMAVHGRPWSAVGYLVATPAAALLAVWIGAASTRRATGAGGRA